MQTDHAESDWLSPAEALDLLEPRYGPGTKILIADKLKDGLIQARAELVWDCDSPGLTAAWKSRDQVDESDVERDAVVAAAVWRSSRHWQWDMDNWRWRDNRFVVTRRKKAPAHRTIIVGLRLRKKDVLDLIKPPSKRAGKKPNYAGYANMFKVLRGRRRMDVTHPRCTRECLALQPCGTRCNDRARHGRPSAAGGASSRSSAAFPRDQRPWRVLRHRLAARHGNCRSVSGQVTVYSSFVCPLWVETGP